MATRTISNAGGNWSATTAWVEGAIPVNGDDVVATATSGNLVVDASPYLKSFDLTNYTGTLSGTSDIRIHLASGTNVCLFAGVITYTGRLVLMADNGATINLTTNGKTLGILYTDFYNSSLGTVSLQDDLTCSSYITVASTIFNTNNHNISCTQFTDGNTGIPRILNLGTSQITCTGTGNVWKLTLNELTANLGSSTIIISNTSATAKTFTGAGQTYGTVTFSGDNTTIVDNNTFTTLNVNTAGLATGLIFTINSTQTVTNFTTNGYASNLAKISSSSAGTAFTLTTASAQISVDYMSIKD